MSSVPIEIATGVEEKLPGQANDAVRRRHNVGMEIDTNLTPTEKHRLCAEAPLSMQTLLRALAGGKVQPITRHRIEAAAERLGLLARFPAGFFYAGRV